MPWCLSFSGTKVARVCAEIMHIVGVFIFAADFFSKRARAPDSGRLAIELCLSRA